MKESPINPKNFFLHFNTVALIVTTYVLFSTQDKSLFYSFVNALDTFSIFLYIATFISVVLLVVVSAINHKANTDIDGENGIKNNGEILTEQDKNRLNYMIQNSFSRLMVTITFNIILIMLIGELSKNYFVEDMSFLNQKGETMFAIATFMFFVWFLPYYDIGRNMFVTKQEN